jgi:hypothetical protein
LRLRRIASSQIAFPEANAANAWQPLTGELFDVEFGGGCSPA